MNASYARAAGTATTLSIVVVMAGTGGRSHGASSDSGLT
jgi:hypothetical protein